MSDLIGRQAAIDAIENTDCELSPDAWDELKNAIMKAPTIDPVKHAKLVNPNPFGECSKCGYLIDIRQEYHYCPNCGAKMDGGPTQSNDPEAVDALGAVHNAKQRFQSVGCVGKGGSVMKGRMNYDFSGQEDECLLKCKECKHSYTRVKESDTLFCSIKSGCKFEPKKIKKERL